MKGKWISPHSLGPDRYGRFSNLASGCQIGNYRIDKWLGSGTFGDVYLARKIDTCEKVAIKLPRLGKNYQKASRQEAEKLRLFSSPFVIGLIDDGEFFWKEYKLHYIVTPFLEFTLYQYMMRQKLSFTNEMTKQLTHNLAAGLAHIHEKKYIHGDLKPENVMWDKKKCCWVIIDVGSAQHETVTTSKGRFYWQSLWWRAPEMLWHILGRYDVKITPAIDMWSLGCILVEVVTNRPPFEGKNSSETLNQIEERLGSRENPIPFYLQQKGIPRLLQNLICFLISYDRMTSSEAGAHPYLQRGVPETLVDDVILKETDESSGDSAVSPTSTPPCQPQVFRHTRTQWGQRNAGKKPSKRRRLKKDPDTPVYRIGSFYTDV